jgi:hypothetical protein
MESKEPWQRANSARATPNLDERSDMDQGTPRRTWPAGTTPLAELTATVPAYLQAACDKANLMAGAVRLCPATCVLTSHALAAYLREVEGLDPTLTRIEAHIFPQRGTGSSLGSRGDGTRRPAAAKGMWHGHLAVTCVGYLLDPTIDQVNDGNMNMSPLVLPLPAGWDDGAQIMFTTADDTFVRYCKYYRQVGWKAAGDARPSHWRPIVDLMIEGDRLWGKE